MSASALFSPLTIGGMTVKNRIGMSPMLMYIAGEDGHLSDLHLSHYGARIIGGVGLVMTEVIAVSPEGRISNTDLGLWEDAQIDGIARLAALAHAADTRFGVQLAHAGRKSTAQARGVAPSPIAYDDHPAPRELTPGEIAQIVDDYAAAAHRAVRAGVDCIEIHASHGYLLHEFLSPLANLRTDEHGGTFENRLRFVLAVIQAVKRELGPERPLFVRIPASDIADGGLAESDGRRIAEAMVAAGADVLDVSTGNITPGYRDPIFPGYQVRFASALHDLPAAIATFGSIDEPGLAEFILASGAADLVFLGRALLRNPFWPLEAARHAGIAPSFPIPTYARATGPYERGF